MFASFLVHPSLDLRSGVEYYCSIGYIQLYQPLVRLVDDVVVQLGTPSDPEDPASEIVWDQDAIYTQTLGASTVNQLLEELRAFVSAIDDFDGKIEGGLVDTKKVVAPWSKITTEDSALRLSSNIASALGQGMTEFAPQNVYRQVMAPSMRRWCPQPLYCTSTSLSDQPTIAESGGVAADDQMPHGHSSMLTRRQPYLYLLPLQRSSVRSLDDVTIVHRPIQHHGMGWHKLSRGVLSQIDFAFYQADGRLVACHPINTYWMAELVIKQRMMLSFA